MGAAVHHFDRDAEPARRLADILGAGSNPIALHRFPDGESLVRVAAPVQPAAILYCSLDDPNAKIVDVLLSASALHENGATRVILVAPYLGYMRQDMAFHPGEAVSQQVIGKLIAGAFDGCVTVDAHLHRIHDLGEVMPGIPAVNLFGKQALSASLDLSVNPLIVGPDGESEQWVRAIAEPLGLDFLVGRKMRDGDRSVDIEFADIGHVEGRHVVLVDDVISSGVTLAVAARMLREADAAKIEALATHCLASSQDLAALHEAGIERIRSSDSIPGPTAQIELAETLAHGIRERGLIA
ncbi:ribose-phosphate diphosphokinase [Qipengyuania zhejiangensis]|uniref:ribose-phosphate diphosphokinase n=1 Tax=Qipengyuania zhejiangensis TaxID=3077782 RepID=UPI002D786365|nr:ribose-phosphate diphosphokinase [Qipengyuania sp. Z2]